MTRATLLVAIGLAAAACSGPPKPVLPPKPPPALPIPGLATLEGSWRSTDLDGWTYDLELQGGTYHQVVTRTTGGPCVQKGSVQSYEQAYGQKYVSPEEQRRMYGGDPYAGPAPDEPPAGTQLALVLTLEQNQCNEQYYQGTQLVLLAYDFDGQRFTTRTGVGWGGAEESHRYEHAPPVTTGGATKPQP